MTLVQKKCVPCEDNSIQPLSCADVALLIEKHGSEIHNWVINDTCTRMTCEKIFPDFLQAIKFVNTVAQIAESEGHHPDITIAYNKVQLDLWTHSIGGLSENDFILAAKINTL